MASANGAGAWQQARASARTHRASLSLPENTSADDTLRAALASAHLRLGKRRPTDPLLSGAHAVLDTEARAVWIRSDAAPEDARVYIAHELGHFHLHGGDNSCQCNEHDFDDELSVQAVGYGPRQRRETEANVWAREFLLPVPLAHHLFYTEGQTAPQIAAQVGLPLTAVWAQLSEALALTPVPSPNNGRGVPVGEATSIAEDAIAGILDTPLPLLGEGTGVRAVPPFPLDPSQEAAARAERGPLLVGAGPGTGKTRTLTERVLYLTGQRGVRPDNILCLTFSRKAAEEMRERIAAQAPAVARRAAISTFHAYGLDLLRRYGKAADLPPNPVLLDPVDACALLERRASSLGLSVLRYLHDPAFPLPDILRTISRAKEEMVSPEEFARRSEEADSDKLRDVARVYTVYEALLREKGALDFSDLVCRALRLLLENEDVRRSEQAQWRHILVDEYQDVNRAGSRMVQAIAGDDAPGLWCVGDLRQAIYRFRGASPANVSRFQTDFPSGRRLDLGVNYRSRPALVSLFGNVSGEGAATWEASRKETEGKPAASISLTVTPTDIAQADFIAGKMQDFAQSEYRYDDMVVLCRTRNQARAMRGMLLDRGIPVAPGPDENGLLGRKDVRDLLTLLSRVADPRGPAKYRFPELPAGLAPSAIHAGDALDLWTDVLWGKPGWARRLTDGSAVQRLLTLARAFRERSKTVLEETDDPRRAFLLHIRRMVRMGASFGDANEDTETDAASTAVRVLTVHGAKGLEFPIVFVPNLSAGKFPARPGPSLIPSPAYDDDTAEVSPDAENSENDEEARLFFVALTRARDHLFLTRAEKYNNRSAAPSPLLKLVEGIGEQMPPSPVPFPPIMGEGVPEGAAGSIAEATGAGLLDTPSPIIGGKGTGDGGQTSPLTVEAWEAELYLRCPRRYYYERVLELPAGERTAYSAFKRAVGAAMDDENPAAALDASWTTHGPEASHPHAALYRQAAEETVARIPASPTPRPRHANNAAEVPEPPTFNLALENGVVTVRPDAADPTGTRLENQTFRKPPAPGEAEAGAEMRLSLLYEAAAAAAQGQQDKEISVSLRYLQTGETLPVANKPRQREKHLAAYDRALNGIGLRVFTPTPADASDCAVCPYFFICPD